MGSQSKGWKKSLWGWACCRPYPISLTLGFSWSSYPSINCKTLAEKSITVDDYFDNAMQFDSRQIWPLLSIVSSIHSTSILLKKNSFAYYKFCLWKVYFRRFITNYLVFKWMPSMSNTELLLIKLVYIRKQMKHN